ncbi:MAG: carbohydrate-binding domain-containing protein [Lachnospiraceae bacterium]|nr:carbohydrate-binding domain-containing protein [Lachnospiraceae bacterium]
MKKKWILATVLNCILVFTGCGHQETLNTSASTEQESMFSYRDYEVGYDEESATFISLEGTGISCNSDAVKISGSTVTITDEGTYILTGTLDDGMIIVDAENTDKLHLVFKDVSINSETSAPIYLLKADKVFITLAEDTLNELTNGGTFETIDDNNIDGVIFSKMDLTLNGSGSLVITSPAGHGIVCKDELAITSGTYEVTANKHGISANDSVKVANGSFTIDSADDAVHSNSSVSIQGGTFEIASGDDAFHADESLAIGAGTINITESYEGLEGLNVEISGGEIKLVSKDDGINAADGDILISGGELYVNASGDGVDANGTLKISGGMTTICGPTTGDTATLDYDTSGMITGGTFIGTGALQMAKTFSSSQQGVITIKGEMQQAGTKIELTDEQGTSIISCKPELSYQVIILSSPDIVKGQIYTVTIGDVTEQVVAD